MISQTITYTDVNGLSRTETFWFNLSRAELIELDAEVGGLEERIQKLSETSDQAGIIKFFKTLILRSYGVKSDDGRRFIKSEDLSNGFYQTDAYSELLWNLLGDTNKAVEFFNGIVPRTAAPTGSAAPISVVK